MFEWVPTHFRHTGKPRGRVEDLRRETTMRVGVVFPQTEIGADVGAIAYYAKTVNELGFSHILAYDHVVGADLDVHPGKFLYDIDTTFHELFVLFGYLAGVVPQLELVTGVLVLPQRPAVLVAKQAAQIDLMTCGRFRLGVGVGWNAVEFEALGADFGNRGRRTDEQIELMRRLWTERSVTFEGQYHRLTAVGLMPKPIQRPIPVWMGARSAPAYRRAGRVADGWFPMVRPGPALDAALSELRQAAVAAGRDPADIGMEAKLDWKGDVNGLVSQADLWAAAGATHASINTMGAGLVTVDDHLAVLSEAADAVLK
jgi:probable F420-dependent oxidoreductase